MGIPAVGGVVPVILSNGTSSVSIPLIGDPKLNRSGNPFLTVASLLANQLTSTGVPGTGIAIKTQADGSPVVFVGCPVFLTADPSFTGAIPVGAAAPGCSFA